MQKQTGQYSKRRFHAMRNKIMKNVFKLNMSVWPEAFQFFFDGRKMFLHSCAHKLLPLLLRLRPNAL